MADKSPQHPQVECFKKTKNNALGTRKKYTKKGLVPLWNLMNNNPFNTLKDVYNPRAGVTNLELLFFPHSFIQ